MHISCEGLLHADGKNPLTLKKKRKKIAPAFVFVDPYGFKVFRAIFVRRLWLLVAWKAFVNIILARVGYGNGFGTTSTRWRHAQSGIH